MSKASISTAAAAAAITGLMSAFANTTQAQVPTINIQETCRAAAGVTLGLTGAGQNDFENCMNSENIAREKMLKDWSTFNPLDRRGCIQPKVYLPSYVEWLTCFEMNKVVREARE